MDSEQTDGHQPINAANLNIFKNFLFFALMKRIYIILSS